MEQRRMNVGYDSCPKEVGLLLHRMLGVFSLWIKCPIRSDERKSQHINEKLSCAHLAELNSIIIRFSLPTSGAYAPKLRFFSPVAMGSFSAALDSIRIASFPRNANTSPACPPPPSPPPAPAPAPAAAAAARASSQSRWTRLSVMETARLSSPPPLHFQLRKNSYSRKRATGQPACPNIAAFLGTIRGRRLSNSRFAAPRRLFSTFYELLDVAIVTAYFFFLFFFAAGPLPLLAARSLVCAHSVRSPSDSSRSDLWARAASRRRATHCFDGRAEQIR